MSAQAERDRAIRERRQTEEELRDRYPGGVRAAHDAAALDYAQDALRPPRADNPESIRAQRLAVMHSNLALADAVNELVIELRARRPS